MIFFFHTPPIFVEVIVPKEYLLRLVRGYVHSKNSYLPRKVQCMKKSYMKGRKKGGLVLVGFLTQIHEILWIMDGSDFVFQLSNAILYFKPTNQKDSCYILSSQYCDCVWLYTLIHISTMSGILKNPFSVVEIGDVDNREIPILMANFAISWGLSHWQF